MHNPEYLGREQVRRLLAELYTSEFQLHGSDSSVKRTADLPRPAATACGDLAGFGQYFGLEGFDSVVQQVRRQLFRLHRGFADHDEFIRGLQLLRLVSAPGMGKVRGAPLIVMHVQWQDALLSQLRRYNMTQFKVWPVRAVVHVLAGHSCISLLQTTALQEVWAKLHQLASEHPDNDPPMASFNRRILSSLKPGAAMVFLTDLMHPGT